MRRRCEQQSLRMSGILASRCKSAPRWLTFWLLIIHWRRLNSKKHMQDRQQEQSSKKKHEAKLKMLDA